MISLCLKKNIVQMGIYRLPHLHTVESHNRLVSNCAATKEQSRGLG